jgi:hypothetical protein
VRKVRGVGAMLAGIPQEGMIHLSLVVVFPVVSSAVFLSMSLSLITVIQLERAAPQPCLSVSP